MRRGVDTNSSLCLVDIMWLGQRWLSIISSNFSWVGKCWGNTVTLNSNRRITCAYAGLLCHIGSGALVSAILQGQNGGFAAYFNIQL